MKCKLRNQMTALCGEPDETPTGLDQSLQQKLFGGQSISRKVMRSETKQINGRLGRCNRRAAWAEQVWLMPLAESNEVGPRRLWN